MLFCPHTSFKMCSNAHLLTINSASARIFASSEYKLSIRAKLSLKSLTGNERTEKLDKVEYQIDANNEWVEQARIVRSPNFDARPEPDDIQLLVIHGISLPPKEYGGCFIDQLFTNCLDPKQHPYFAEIQHLRVSSHLLIDRKGQLSQYVPLRERAWHAGESSFHGREKCNDFSIGIELEGCDDEAYCDVQYKRLAEITNVICRRWRKITKDRIVGHSDIAPGRKTDPGPAFDWDYFYSLIKL